jgi:hypothetical protein
LKRRGAEAQERQRAGEAGEAERQRGREAERQRGREAERQEWQEYCVHRCSSVVEVIIRTRQRGLPLANSFRIA